MAKSKQLLTGLKPDLPVGRAAVRTLRQRLAVFPGLLRRAAHKSDVSPRTVHELRVACRRASAALLVYRSLLRSSSTDWWRKRLRKLRRSGGAVRTLDVLLSRIEEADSSSALRERLAAERRDRLQILRKALDRFPSPERLAARRKKLLNDIRWRGKDEPVLRDWATTPLAEAIDSFLKCEPDRQTDFSGLHTFRVAGKRLRYSLELLADAIGSPAVDLIPVIEELQTRLGSVQDQFDACRRIGLAMDDVSTVRDLDTSIRLLQAMQAALRRDVQSFWSFWRGVRPRIKSLARRLRSARESKRS